MHCQEDLVLVLLSATVTCLINVNMLHSSSWHCWPGAVACSSARYDAILNSFFMQMVHMNVAFWFVQNAKKTSHREGKIKSLNSLAAEAFRRKTESWKGQCVLCRFMRCEIAPTTSQMFLWLLNLPPFQIISSHLDILFSSKNIAGQWIVNRGGGFPPYTHVKHSKSDKLFWILSVLPHQLIYISVIHCKTTERSVTFFYSVNDFVRQKEKPHSPHMSILY